MSASDTLPRRAAPDKSYEEVRKAWHAANVRPLWENPLAHKLPGGGPKGHHWKWQVLRPLVGEAIKVTTPAAVERRVLSLDRSGCARPGRRHLSPISPRLCRCSCRARRRGRTATP